MPKDTTSRGELTELEIAIALARSGRRVLRPLSAGLRYDLVIDNKDGTFARIQCKTGLLKAGAVEFRVYNADGRRPHGVRYQGQIEAFGVFCPQNGQAYLVPMAAVADMRVTARLRLDRPKNGQRKGIRYASVFEILRPPEGGGQQE